MQWGLIWSLLLYVCIYSFKNNYYIDTNDTDGVNGSSDCKQTD